MVTKRQKQATGLAATALLLIGSAYAWQSNDKHRTNEMKDAFSLNDVTLVEDFKPITDWKVGDAVNQGIAVMNRLQDQDGNKAFVRIQIKEFLELTDKTENYSDKRYAVTTEGKFACFDTEAEAKAYAEANGLPDAQPEEKTETVFDYGTKTWFIPTDAGGYNGQYGDFLLESLGDSNYPKASIIDATVENASDAAKLAEDDPNGEHNVKGDNAEDTYTTQLFNGTGDDMRTYDGANRVNTYPTGSDENNILDLKSYITWQLGDTVTTLADFDETSRTGQWVINPSDGYVYWSKPLNPGETTPEFLSNVTLAKAFKNTTIYYAIHTNLEAVDQTDIPTLGAPEKIEVSWTTPVLPSYTVSFDSKGGTSTPEAQEVISGDTATQPVAPTKYVDDILPEEGPDLVFGGWYTDEALTEVFDFDAPITSDITLRAKWQLPIKDVGSNANPTVADGIFGNEFDQVWFANAWWRIIKPDMGGQAGQALVLKVNTLTNREAGKADNDGEAKVTPREQNEAFYLSGNGYELGGGNPNYLKGAIDNYYTANIGGTVLTTFVNAVDLHLPSFATLKSGATNFSGNYTDMIWSDWYKDTRFATTLTGVTQKQAFALSTGDFHTLAGVGGNDKYSNKIDFSGVSGSSVGFGFRSIGGGSNMQAVTYNPGELYDVAYTLTSRAIRPALSLNIK